MSVKSQDYSHVCVISINGDLVESELESARKPFEQRLSSGAVVNFIVDLEQCEFADSTGLETLLWMKRKSEDLGGQVKLVVTSPTLKTIMDITRLSHRFEIHTELAPALKNM